MSYLEPIDYTTPDGGDLYDELPLWSALFGQRLLERVPLTNGLTYLDVGCGTGFLTVELAQRAGAQSKVIAVDPWSTAMDRLRRKLAYMQIENVALHEQDALSLALPDECVDVIVSNLGVNNFEDPVAVLKVLHRTAKPDARLILTTNLSGHMDEFFAVFRETLIERDMRDRLIPLEEHIAHRGTVDSVSEMLRRAQFTVSNVETSSFVMRYADGSSFLRHHFIRMGFLQSWVAVVGEEVPQPVFDALERNLNAAAVTNGELRLTVPMACIEARRDA